jgi:hypothetical protein
MKLLTKRKVKLGFIGLRNMGSRIARRNLIGPGGKQDTWGSAIKAQRV